MPATDSELIAYRWGQRHSLRHISDTLPEGVRWTELPDTMTALERGAVLRLGRRAFKYWAERGAAGAGPQ